MFMYPIVIKPEQILRDLFRPLTDHKKSILSKIIKKIQGALALACLVWWVDNEPLQTRVLQVISSIYIREHSVKKLVPICLDISITHERYIVVVIFQLILNNYLRFDDLKLIRFKLFQES